MGRREYKRASRIVYTTLPEEHLRAVRTVADRLHLTTSAAIRWIITDWLQNIESPIRDIIFQKK